MKIIIYGYAAIIMSLASCLALANQPADYAHLCQDKQKCSQELKHILLEAAVSNIPVNQKVLTANVKELIQRGADVNSKGEYRGEYIAPLFYALWTGNPDLINLLLERGAAINEKNGDGRTPLYYAENAAVVKLLVNKGAHVNVRDHQGQTPLFHAVWLGRDEVVKALLDLGANVNEKDNEGKTPLYGAVGKGDINMTKLLLTKNALINIQDNEGNTPLFAGVDRFDLDELKDQLKISKILIGAKADVTLKNKFGLTVYDYYRYPVDSFNPAEADLDPEALEEAQAQIQAMREIMALFELNGAKPNPNIKLGTIKRKGSDGDEDREAILYDPAYYDPKENKFLK